MGTSHKDRYTFLNISPLVLLRTRNILNTSSRENQNTLFFLNHAFYEIMWKNTVEPEGPQMTVWHMRISCWIHRVKDLQPEYVTHCSSTATMVARTYFTVTLCIHYLA